jgi:hypothetical protein
MRKSFVVELVWNDGRSDDQAWFGLNSVSQGTGGLDVLTPRPTSV